jgi:hypothetical protein
MQTRGPALPEWQCRYMNWSPGENPELDRCLAQLDEELPPPSKEADEGTRTPDPLLTMEVLYQLSYVGVFPAVRPVVGGAGFEPA